MAPVKKQPGPAPRAGHLRGPATGERDAAPDPLIGGRTKARYLTTGGSTGGRYGLDRWEMGAEPSGGGARFHRTGHDAGAVRAGGAPRGRGAGGDRGGGRRLSEAEWADVYGRHDQYMVRPRRPSASRGRPAPAPQENGPAVEWISMRHPMRSRRRSRSAGLCGTLTIRYASTAVTSAACRSSPGAQGSVAGRGHGSDVAQQGVKKSFVRPDSVPHWPGGWLQPNQRCPTSWSPE